MESKCKMKIVITITDNLGSKTMHNLLIHLHLCALQIVSSSFSSNGSNRMEFQIVATAYSFWNKHDLNPGNIEI